MAVLRTLDERFEHPPGYAFAANYRQIGDTRIHYVDEGAGTETMLCLHGEPTWLFLYRKLIPPLAAR